MAGHGSLSVRQCPAACDLPSPSIPMAIDRRWRTPSPCGPRCSRPSANVLVSPVRQPGRVCACGSDQCCWRRGRCCCAGRPFPWQQHAMQVHASTGLPKATPARTSTCSRTWIWSRWARPPAAMAMTCGVGPIRNQARNTPWSDSTTARPSSTSPIPSIRCAWAISRPIPAIRPGATSRPTDTMR